MFENDGSVLRYSSAIMGIVNGNNFLAGNAHKTINEITEAVSSSLMIERVGVWMYGDDRLELRCVDLYEQTPASHSDGHVHRQKDWPAYFAALAENCVLVVHNAPDDPRTSELVLSCLAASGISSKLDVPINRDGVTVGFINLEHVGPGRDWSDEDITVAGYFADLVAHVLATQESKQAVDVLRKNARQLQTIYHQIPAGISLEDYSGVKRLTDKLARNGVRDFREHFRNNKQDLDEAIDQIKILDVNDFQVTMFGASSVEEYCKFDTGPSLVMTFGWYDYYLEEISVFAEGGNEMSKEVRTSRIDGTGMDVNCTSRITSDHKDDWSEVVSIHKDITDRKQSEAALQNALVEAERANQAKSEFLATMSHEFRTPLNAILGFSEMIRAEYFGPLGSDNYQDYARSIFHSGEHLLDLINDILNIAAIEAGKKPMVKENIFVDTFLRDCVTNMGPLAKECSVYLTVDIPDELNPLYADKRALTQVILNLLSNAIKFTEDDGTITVSVSAFDDGMIFKISDTGIGIPDDIISHITDAFVQSNADPHIAQSGTGLGLTIVKSLVEANGGVLNIESEYGKGTTVTVWMPGLPENTKKKPRT